MSNKKTLNKAVPADTNIAINNLPGKDTNAAETAQTVVQGSDANTSKKTLKNRLQNSAPAKVQAQSTAVQNEDMQPASLKEDKQSKVVKNEKKIAAHFPADSAMPAKKSAKKVPSPVQTEIKNATPVKKIKAAKPVKITAIDSDAPQAKKISKTVSTRTATDALNKQKTINTVIEIAQTENAVSQTIKKIFFQVKYSTVSGQSLYVSGNHTLLGHGDPAKALPLSYLNQEYWYGVLEVSDGQPFSGSVLYNYVLQNTDGTYTTDWGNDKFIDTAKYNAEEIFFLDTWNDSSLVENTFYTEPFRGVLLKHDVTGTPPASTAGRTHIFRVKAPVLPQGHAVCISGSAAPLGNWSVHEPVLLWASGNDIWYSVSLNLSETDFPIAYKYGVYDLQNQRLVSLETGNNRVLYEGYSANQLTVVSDGFINIPYGAFKGAGVAIPVFSLRSKNSFGAGEFSDLKLLVDWAAKIGLRLVQLLPVNDTTATHTYTDSYPYAAISAFALHPLYLHLPLVVNKENSHFLASLNEMQTDLNSKPEVDYVAAMGAKWKLLKQIFPSQKAQTFKSGDFHHFFTENAHWLVPYAAFSYLREKYNTSDFATWPEHSIYSSDEIYTLASTPLKAVEELSIYYYVQYHLHLQLKDATDYAHKHGIIVKGDIPIGIYRHSCDAWEQPQLYNMDKQAGAPPDDFAVKGQNWGFPTYNWLRMKEDGFQWWKQRFKQMSYYFDAFRIDHILGFFRIWSIPLDAVQGILGHFVPAVPVHIHEFHSRGIYFDHNRLCRPYINEYVLYSLFGTDSQLVKDRFLDSHDGGALSLKPAFDKQRKVEDYFDKEENTGENQHIKEGLYDLISNVILLEEEGSSGQHFHFRISMEGTLSFQHLDGHTQQQLRELYLDYFYSRQDDFWKKEAMQKLPELKRSTNMLICGEDLGMVPASVPGVMHDLAILSLEIQRMPKDPKREFFHPNDAPYLSVVTPSTHDMSTIRGWWQEDRAATQRFYNQELGQWGTAPYFCEPWINRIILLQHFYSPAMWSIFQLQDLLGISPSLRRNDPADERINIPADPKHYWRYRMHMPLEELLGEDEFNNEIKTIVQQCGRL